MNEHPAWRSPLHTIRERIAFAVSAAGLRVPAFRIIDALQGSHPSHQMEALALALTAMAQTLNLNPHDLVERAKRQLPDAEGPFTEQLQAIRDYAKGELRR